MGAVSIEAQTAEIQVSDEWRACIYAVGTEGQTAKMKMNDVWWMS